MKPFDPVTLAVPAFIVLVIAEMLFVRFTGRGRFEVRDTATSLMMGLGSTIIGAIFAFVFVGFARLIQPDALAHILILIGFPLEMIAFVHGINLVYQFWIHTEAVDRFPRWIEAVMNTPSHHRVHHATNARYLDANYAGVFIVWDRMFGSFVEESKEDAPRYGIVGNIASFNPLKVAAHGWVALGSDLAKSKSPREFVLYLLAPPGWSPDGSRDTSETIKARWDEFRAAQSPAE
jgi:sterol desaturase/sphingolipid hydroxylase (fatty acid hydroxylase superfamily)